MAAIAGIGASALLQFVQGLGSSTPAPTATTATPNAPKQGGGAHHRHGQGGLKQIQSAVLGALQSAKTAAGTASAGGSISDPDQVIQDAIAKVLKSKIAAPTADAGGTTDVNATDAAPQSFEDILQSFGVTPQQFESDFSAAIKGAQNGQANSASVFQNFQPGSLLDITG
jgi:hypothetical protein